MNVRISISAALAVLLASLSINSVLKGGAWLSAGSGAVIVVMGVGIATRLSTVGSVVGITLGVLLGMVPLLSAPTWSARIIGLVIVALTAASVTGRRLLRSFATATAYLAALLIYLNLVFANAASFLRLVPTYHSVRLLGQLVPLAFDEFKFSPPVLDTRPVSLVAAAGIGLTAVIVDIVAVRLRRPALAGVPLLVLFCVPVATALKTFGVVQTVIFAAALAGFLGLLSADGRMRLRMWGRLVTFRYVQSADETGAGPDTRELAASGRRIGLAALCLAVAIPVILPTVHSHSLFGTAHGGNAQGPGGLDAFLRVQHDLIEKSEPVLSYTTDARDPAQQYFQVFVLNYSNSQRTWLPEIPVAVGGESAITGPALPYPPHQLATATVRVRTQVQMAPVQDSGSTAYLAVPYYPVDLSVPGNNWEELSGSAMILGPDESLSNLSYSVTSREADLAKADIENSNHVVPGNVQGQYGDYSGPDATKLLSIAHQHTQGALTPLQDAIDLQNWLKSRSFKYTLRPDLPKSHWLLHFLTDDRRGYCQQFAWAMAVLARLVGIPSRVAVGYTAGSRGAGGRWYVSTSDAHAWPELYLAGQGWLRFEPTPNGTGAQGSATVPGYATGPSTTSSGVVPGTPSQNQSGPGSSTKSGKKNQVINRFLHNQPGLGAGGAGSIGAVRWLPIGIPLLLLLLLGTPALIRRVTRRRRWLAASGDAGLAHAAWRELTDDMADLGMPSAPGETPRAVAGRLGRLAGFDPSAAVALARIADAEERARYARRPAPGDGLAADLRAVRRAAAATAPRRKRIRATLLPASTMAAGRRLAERVFGLLGWLDASWPAVRRQMRRSAAQRSG
jgi:transglutaminase-like putative cysteine protease